MRGPWLLAVVAGESMEPALRSGDRVLVRRGRAHRPGTIVVAAHPARSELLVVKRLAALPGQVVYGGALAVDEYWLSSDNLLVAPDDSRDFGPVSRAALVGRVALRYWPLIRSSRKGTASASESKT